MKIKELIKKINILLLISMIFGGSLFSENSNILVQNNAYIIENLNQSGTQVEFDIWVRGSADAVMEIFDKNGERKSWESIPGKKGSSDIISDITDKWGDTYSDIKDGVIGDGQRSHVISKKSTINITIPEGGKFKISKSSDLAQGVNYANMGIELLSKIGISNKLFGKSTGESAASAFADALLSRPLLLTALSKTNNSEFSTAELYSELAQVGISVLKSAAIAEGNNATKNMLEGVTQKLFKSGISVWIKGAEILAFTLNNDLVRRDLNYHRENKDKFEIIGNDTSTNNPIKAIKDSNKKILKNLANKDTELKEKIESVTEKKHDLESKENAKSLASNERRNAMRDVKNSKQGSDERKQAIFDLQYWQREYKNINNDISSLKSIISDINADVNNLQIDINYLVSNIEDTTDNYNNNSKLNISNTKNFTVTKRTVFKDWVGKFTFNSENKDDEKLRYWGGNFGDTNNGLLGGSNMFTRESDSSDNVKSVHLEHGTNTATDTTQEFDITNSEISTNSIFYDTNIKTLKIQKNIQNSDTLKLEAKGHYQYTAWGDWSQTGGLITDNNGGNGIEQMALHNNWSIGQKTQDLPTQGSATYNGVVSGNWYQGSIGGSYGGKINGTMAMSVDFAKKSVVSGTMNLTKTSGGSFAIVTMNNMQMSRTNSAFAGNLVGVNVAEQQTHNNKIHGQFNGPNAEEISGSWTVDSTSGDYASGVFAGKR